MFSRSIRILIFKTNDLIILICYSILNLRLNVFQMHVQHFIFLLSHTYYIVAYRESIGIINNQIWDFSKNILLGPLNSEKWSFTNGCLCKAVKSADGEKTARTIFTKFEHTWPINSANIDAQEGFLKFS